MYQMVIWKTSIYDLYIDNLLKNDLNFELINDKYITLKNNDITYFLLDTNTKEILYQAKNEFEGVDYGLGLWNFY